MPGCCFVSKGKYSKLMMFLHRILTPSFSFVLLLAVKYIFGQTCVYTDFPDMSGPDTNYIFTAAAATLTACKQKCDSNPSCIALQWSGRICWGFSKMFTVATYTGRTYSNKSCVEDTTTTVTTTTLPTVQTTHTTADTTTTVTTTTLPTVQTTHTTAAVCTMAQNANTNGGVNYAFRFGFNQLSECETACKLVQQCVAYSFYSNVCYLHLTLTTTTLVGSWYGLKQPCDDGSQCCFLDMKDFKGVSSTLTLASDVASCEAFCLSASTFCMAVTYSLNVCYIYTTLPSGITANSQSTYSVKVCPAGTTAGTFTLAQYCQGGTSLRWSALLLLSSCLAHFIMTNLHF